MKATDQDHRDFAVLLNPHVEGAETGDSLDCRGLLEAHQQVFPGLEDLLQAKEWPVRIGPAVFWRIASDEPKVGAVPRPVVLDAFWRLHVVLQ